MMKNINALHKLLLPEELITHKENIQPFCEDYRGRFFGQAMAVVQPKSVTAVQKTVKFCYENHINIVPQGGNTGLCGGATPDTSAHNIILSLRRLNQLRNISLKDSVMTVDAGLTLEQAQQAASRVNRFFPLSLASEGSCQIGGNIACNAGGLSVVRYGPMRSLVAGLEVVLPNGELISSLSALHKNTTGLDLKQLFIGSEGTLGVITAASLWLFAVPKTYVTAWVGVDTIGAAVRLLNVVQSTFGERLSSFELLSRFALDLSIRYVRTLAQPADSKWHVLLELSDTMLNPNLQEALLNLLADHNWLNCVLAQNEEKRAQLWRLRESLSDAQRALGVSIKHDIALPISRVAHFVNHCEKLLLQAYPTANLVIFGHLGDGSLHYNVFIPKLLDQDVYALEEGINQLVYDCVIAHDGTIAAEHGIGQLKTKWLQYFKQQTELECMKAIKGLLDRKNIMNPHKII